MGMDLFAFPPPPERLSSEPLSSEPLSSEPLSPEPDAARVRLVL
jgi:hypothetical protein